MPNWCLNRLRISGAPQELREFVQLVGSDELCLDFRRHVPETQPPRPTSDAALARLFADEPNVLRWGTKWLLFAEDIEFEGVPGEATYTFSSANSPPDAWLQATAALHAELSFELIWAEGGEAGVLELAGGRVLNEETHRGRDAVKLLRDNGLPWWNWEPSGDE